MAEVNKTERIIKEFNLEEALRGGKIAFVNNPTANISNITEDNITAYVEYFQKTDSNSKANQYKGMVGTTKYFFDYKGRPSDNKPEHVLFSVDATITTSKGEEVPATRGDAGSEEEVVVNIVALQPREQFAMAAMKGILYHIVDPVHMSNAQVLDVVNMSFNLANAMMLKAAEVRADLKDNSSSASGREEEIEVNPEELTNNSDKILYNLNENLFKVVDQISSNDKGVRIKPTNDAQFKVANVAGTVLEAKVTNTVDTNIKSTSIDVPVDIQNNPVPVSGTVRVSNMITEPVSAYVTNMPSVPSEPVSITGTVSVDNFPSSDSGSETT